MFYLVGLGLGDERDITLRGLEVVRGCARVYLEHYTAILTGVAPERLAKLYGRPVELATREMVEGGADELLAGAGEGDVALLVVGDPFGCVSSLLVALLFTVCLCLAVS